MIGRVRREPLYGCVQIEQQCPLSVVTHHALYPEKRREARPARDRGNVVQAARRIKDQAPGIQLHLLNAEVVFDHELAAFVFGRSGKEKRRRKVGPNTVLGACDLANGVIDVGPEILAAAIPVKKRRKDLSR